MSNEHIYELSVAAMMILGITSGLYMWRRLQYYRGLRDRRSEIGEPTNDDERLELSDINQQLAVTFPNWVLWLGVTFGGLTLIFGVLFEVLGFLHIGGAP